jgi:TonB family protein
MRVVYRGDSGRLGTSISFAISGGIHGLALAWVALGPALRVPEAPQSLYDREIRPDEARIVWYNLRDRLPEISPGRARRDVRAPRARVRATQPLAAGARDDARPPQMIWMPDAPEIAPVRPQPLPNVVAVMPSRPVRPFVPPSGEPKPQPAQAPVLPDAPRVAVSAENTALPFAAPNPRLTRAFTPPPEARRAVHSPVLPDAPRVAMSAETTALPFAAPNPRLMRAFTPPPEVRRGVHSPVLPDAPRVAMSAETTGLPFAAPNPRLTRAFTPPPGVRRAVHSPVLPDAPRVAVSAENTALPFAAPNPRLTRAFTPPEVRRAAQSPVLPEAPRVAMNAETPGLPFAAPNPRLTRAFTPPPGVRRAVHSPVLPDAPRVAISAETPGLPFAAPNSRITRAFTPPEVRRAAHSPVLPDAPESPADGGSQAELAIAGLNPANTRDIPPPPGSRQAGFSAGPQPHPGNADIAEASPGPAIVVPGLLARGQSEPTRPTLVAGLAPTSPHNLAEAARMTDPRTLPAPSRPGAPAVAAAPDPMLAGRVVYRIAIQMPNVTSYIGSWIVWFAERVPRPGTEIRAPVALRKVDPKYMAAAVAERVEGKVRLAAVIHSDGRIDSIILLQGIDPRLDRSAEEALAKWAFEPALRDGVPIDVDAVFEVPFQLAPRPHR